MTRITAIHTYMINRHSGCHNFVIIFPLLKSCPNWGFFIQFRNLVPILEHCLNYETLFGSSSLVPPLHWSLVPIWKPWYNFGTWFQFWNIVKIMKIPLCPNSETLFHLLRLVWFSIIVTYMEPCPSRCFILAPCKDFEPCQN